MHRQLIYSSIPTPLGPMVAIGNDEALSLLAFEQDRHLPLKLSQLGPLSPGEALSLVMIRSELKSYFEGSNAGFKTPLQPLGTPFQKKVWEELMKIPYGVSMSYKELAQMIGKPSACRAVANANGKNPIAIAIPCHRIIGSDGTLGGYSGGISIKKELALLEGF